MSESVSQIPEVPLVMPDGYPAGGPAPEAAAQAQAGQDSVSEPAEADGAEQPFAPATAVSEPSSPDDAGQASPAQE